ncbi:sarcosine oxidase [Thalassobacillus cyri]|uniref:Sarcosine oxidase n=1 Tax=Thalassobacillus cyri TaxID=571932 RepID=A0A1H3W080_9BACI|nr:N-methyl-L-tryptophan oxidase [Thalassobacillus cyri]SDZ80380.1 sarcosine oxidase [Thalassobacillus cyri]
MDADIGIIGVGTMGSMAMWQLARKGVSVLGFEQFGTGHDRSAASGESRLFRTVYFEGEKYVPLLQDAKKLWSQLEEESGNQLLTLNGGVMIGNPNFEEMKNAMKSIKDFSLEHELLSPEQAKERYPQHHLESEEIMILDKNAGFLRPELSTVSAVARAESLGATVNRYTKIEEIIPDDNGVTIRTKNNEYRVGKVLVTAGPWAGKLLPQLNEIITVKRIVLSWYTPKNINQFMPEQFPVFAHLGDDFKLTGTPTIEGSMVKASNNPTFKDVSSPDQLNREVSIEEIITASNVIKGKIPGLIPHPVRSTAYMDASTPDGHPIVGEVPEIKNTVFMCGFSGHGFKMSPVMGKIAAELLVDGKTNYSIEHLSPQRMVDSASLLS